MIRWRASHPAGLWLLPGACVGVIAAIILLAAAVT
jgi:hypothetical protein